MRESRVLAAAGAGLLLVAASVPAGRPILAIVLGAGWLALWRLRRPEAIAWAAALPVAVGLVWPWVVGSDTPIGAAACSSPVSIIALRRVALAAAVLLVVGGLAIAHRSSPGELGLRRAMPLDTVLAIGGAVVLVVGGLVVGPWVARPFFGELAFPVPPAAFLPGVLFGFANGVSEEVAYRGALQGWLGRLAPVPVAIGFQALVFGIVHAGPEVVALLPVHVALLAAVGIAGGLVRWRTGSLWIPAGIHVGADVALYIGLACRSAA